MASAQDFTDNPDWTALIAERKIQDAIDAGLFDNLPGRGEPLDLTVNPFEPPGMGAVNRRLKANKVLPPWLLLEREIEASRALALAVLARWEASEPALRNAPGYEAARDAARSAYVAHIAHNNDLVLKYNYSAPFAHRAPVPLMRQTRLREFDAKFGDASSHAVSAPSPLSLPGEKAPGKPALLRMWPAVKRRTSRRISSSPIRGGREGSDE